MSESKDPTPELTPQPRLEKGWPLLLLALAAGGVVVLGRLLSIPADPKNSVLLGYSLSRLVMVAGVLGLVLLFGGLAWLAGRRPLWRARWLDGALRGTAFKIWMVVLCIVPLGVWAALLALHPTAEDPFFPYYQRFHPLAVWLFVLSLQALLGLLMLRFGLHPAAWQAERGAARSALVIWGLMLVVGLLAAVTGLGIVPDAVAWGRPGIPVLFLQMMIAWLAGGVVIAWSARAGAKAQQAFPWVDVLLMLALWGCAVLLWQSQPVQRSFFAPQGRAPNFEFYPYSDSGFYGYVSQSLQIGNGYLGNQIITRPLYILFLAGLHALAGQGYEEVIAAQTLVLALLPVAFYLLGSRLHSRALGVMAALLAVAREMNSFAATPLTAVSHSKLFLTDLPTMLLLVLFAWLVVRWLQEPGRRRMDPLLIGGAMGLIMLVRTQALLILPFVGLMALWKYRGRWLHLLEAGLLVGLGMLLALFPWLHRNYQITGQIMFDQPSNQTAILGQRYSLDVGGFPQRMEGESDAEYSDRMLQIARQFMREHPDEVARFTAAHFLNNEISAVLALPMRFSFDDVRDTLVIDDLYWPFIIERFTTGDGVILFINLGLVALGVAALWRRWGVVGLTPLLFNLAYSLSNAVARNSGWRYILPVDWVGYFYFAAGLLQLVLWGMVLLGASRERVERVLVTSAPAANDRPGELRIGRGLAIGLCVLFIGALPPLAEKVIPARYAPETREQLVAELAGDARLQSLGVSPQQIIDFAAQKDAVIFKGRALYPRFYPPLEGEPGTGWPAYKPYEYRRASRLGFLMVGPFGVRHSVLVMNQPPARFPNAADVIVMGCQEKGYVDVLVAAVLDGKTKSLSQRSLPAWQCPLK